MPLTGFPPPAWRHFRAPAPCALNRAVAIVERFRHRLKEDRFARQRPRHAKARDDVGIAMPLSPAARPSAPLAVAAEQPVFPRGAREQSARARNRDGTIPVRGEPGGLALELGRDDVGIAEPVHRTESPVHRTENPIHGTLHPQKRAERPRQSVKGHAIALTLSARGSRYRAHASISARRLSSRSDRA